MYIVYSAVPNVSLKYHRVRSLKLNFLFVILEMIKNDQAAHV